MICNGVYYKLGTLYFVHDFYRDYFAAKHILNAIEALDIGFKSRSEKENDEYFEQLEIKDRWFDCTVDFNDKYNAFRMIGEISGDYNNADLENHWYKKTLLDKFLDLNRRKKIHVPQTILSELCGYRAIR